MKLKKLATTFASLSLMSSFAHADISVTVPNNFAANATDICSQISGPWAGDGQVEATVGSLMKVHISCDYHGVGTITKSNTGNTFKMDIGLTSSSSVCPNEQLNLSGTCSAGKITLNTDSANLTGSLSQGGARADMTGVVRNIDVDVPVLGHETIDANVTKMTLYKQN